MLEFLRLHVAVWLSSLHVVLDQAQIHSFVQK